ncbi:hypothetical protein [Roseospira navarrensis]|uniref:Uncharacterized protein n=1 Tax=Roseospira navarrensis TaxID=140058 RepID=A0A7X1ZEV4_9PROT|nr:hypothetical protein [Roseospira navarrensis]MQX37288.1 hypothetical protein [Roseospira navarrensis]
MDVLDRIDSDAAAALKEKADQVGRLQAQLKSMSSDAQESRKAAARQKIARIKAQLQALRFLAATNPEAAARQAARLARELASAVRDYKAAGGASGVGAGLGGTIAAPAVPGGAAAGPGQSASAGAASPDAAQAGTPLQAAVPPPPAIPTLSSSGAPVSDETAGGEDSGTEAGASADPEPDPEADPAATPGGTPWTESGATNGNRDAGSSREDAEFAAEARRLMAEIKAILEEAERNSRLEDQEERAAVKDAVRTGRKAMQATGAARADVWGTGAGATMPVVSLLV